MTTRHGQNEAPAVEGLEDRLMLSAGDPVAGLDVAVSDPAEQASSEYAAAQNATITIDQATSSSVDGSVAWVVSGDGEAKDDNHADEFEDPSEMVSPRESKGLGTFLRKMLAKTGVL